MEPIVRERWGETAVLRMAHGKVNALDVDLCSALMQALEEAERDAAPVVLTGAGTAFSAGVDLRQVLAGGRAYLEAFLPLLRGAFERLALFPHPVVAAVNGHAIAGGFILLAAADQALVTDGHCRLGVTELLVGVPFPGVALELLRMRAGVTQAAELAYRGSTFAPGEARDRGLVDEVVPPDRLLDRAVELAGTLAAGRTAFTLTKRQLRQPLRELSASLPGHDAEVDEVWQHPATLTAVSRYVDAVMGS